MSKKDYPKIDFVVTWVDGSDPEWQKEKAKYSGEDKRISKYRDWDLLKYWFRGVEKFAPWVNKVHFVTYGHLPKWLNTECPKLHVVKHSDYIPKEYLPTFSSHPIELNLHRIPGLAEHFSYFNDDVYIVAPVRPTDFFKRGEPRARAILNINCTRKNWDIQYINNNCIGLINSKFDFRKTILRNINKWYNLAYGIENMKNIWLSPCPRFPGIRHYHANANFEKSIIEEANKLFEEDVDSTCRNKFRKIADINQYLYQDYIIVKGKFVPQRKISKFIDLKDDNSLKVASNIICGQKRKVVCINDADTIDEKSFRRMKEVLKKAFEEIFPEKSIFER